MRVRTVISSGIVCYFSRFPVTYASRYIMGGGWIKNWITELWELIADERLVLSGSDFFHHHWNVWICVLLNFDEPRMTLKNLSKFLEIFDIELTEFSMCRIWLACVPEVLISLLLFCEPWLERHSGWSVVKRWFSLTMRIYAGCTEWDRDS